MFGINNNTQAKVSSDAFGPRGQTYLKSLDQTQGTGNGSAGNGAKVADQHSNHLHDHYEASPFSKHEADQLDSMQQYKQNFAHFGS
jgi:endo-1,4-beta-mannosidase